MVQLRWKRVVETAGWVWIHGWFGFGKRTGCGRSSSPPSRNVHQIWLAIRFEMDSNLGGDIRHPADRREQHTGLWTSRVSLRVTIPDHNQLWRWPSLSTPDSISSHLHHSIRHHLHDCAIPPSTTSASEGESWPYCSLHEGMSISVKLSFSLSRQTPFSQFGCK